MSEEENTKKENAIKRAFRRGGRRAQEHSAETAHEETSSEKESPAEKPSVGKTFKGVRLSLMELEKKIQEHREQRNKWLWLALLICAAVIALVFVYRHVATFEHYRAVISVERNDTEATKYAAFGDVVIRYGNDGASCFSADSTTVWTQTYEMENPIISVRDAYVAIADQKGKTIYILNEEGLCRKIATDLPIQKIDVSNAGNVAVLMQEENSISYLGLYSLTGRKTAEGTLHFGTSGYPLALALSDDGQKLALSVLDIKEGKGKSTVNFYDFGKIPEEGKDNQVASFSYEDTVIPALSYGSGERLVAYGDNRVICFRGGTKPQEAAQVEVTRQIKSIVHDADRFGLLYDQSDDAGGSTLVLYDNAGNEKQTIAIHGQYAGVGFMNNGEIYLIQGKDMAIYRRNGREKFRGSADTPFQTVLSQRGGMHYIFIREGKTEQVRLRGL